MGNLLDYPEDEEEYEYEQEEEEEIVPFDITVLPPDLIHNIVRNLSYQDYINLEECSNFTDRMLNSAKFSLFHRIATVYVNKKTIKFDMPYHYHGYWRRTRWNVAAATPAELVPDAVVLDCPATSGRIKTISKLLKKNKATSQYLRIMKQIRFTPDDLDQLVTAMKAQHLYSAVFIPRDFFSNNVAMNKLQALTLDTCGCTDEDLARLMVPCITMVNDFITDRGLNRFLKQWKRKAREVSWFQIEFGSTQGARNYDLILEEVQANALWTPALHGDSIIAAMDMEELPLAVDPTHLYSLWRCDDLETVRLLTLTTERMEITSLYCERTVLLNNLTEDQYYTTFKSCKWCEAEFCRHRRWYSTQRFKRFFPKIYGAAMEGLLLISHVYALARCFQHLTGTPLMPQQISTDEIKRIRHEEQIDQSFWKSLFFNSLILGKSYIMGGVVTKERRLFEEIREEYQRRIEEIKEMERNAEPLDLIALPEELIHRIVNKLDYADFIHLERCSLATENILNSRDFLLKHFVPGIYINKKTVKVSNEWDYYSSELPRIPWHVATQHEARLKADVVNITHRATSGRIQAVAKLFEENKTTAEVLNINEHILFAPEDLDRLLTVLKITHLDCRQFLPREFFAHHCLENLTSMTLYTTGCTDEELLHLKQDVLYMTNDFVTAKGLNRFLMQWKRGERKMNVIDIEFDTSFNTRNFDIILEGLDANPVWTPALHEHSIVRDIKLEEYYPMTTSDPEHVYSIFQTGDVTKFRMVRLSMGRFEVFSADNEAEFLLSYLDMDQYYLVTGICPLCAESYCCHRRYLSTQRFKKYFPRTNAVIIAGFQLASKLFVLGRYSQVLLGAPPLPATPLTAEQVSRMYYEDEEHNTTSPWKNFLFNLRLRLFHY